MYFTVTNPGRVLSVLGLATKLRTVPGGRPTRGLPRPTPPYRRPRRHHARSLTPSNPPQILTPLWVLYTINRQTRSSLLPRRRRATFLRTTLDHYNLGHQPSAIDPHPAASVATTTADNPAGPPASVTPVAPTLPASTGPPASNLHLGTQVEPESTPQMDTTTSSIPDPTVHSMDPFPDLDQYFADSPPAKLRPRPDTRLSSSASQSPTFRSKRSGGVNKKSKSSPASQAALAAGVRIRTNPQAVTVARRRGLNQNQFRVLSDDLDGSGDPDLNT